MTQSQGGELEGEGEGLAISWLLALRCPDVESPLWHRAQAFSSLRRLSLLCAISVLEGCLGEPQQSFSAQMGGDDFLMGHGCPGRCVRGWQSRGSGGRLMPFQAEQFAKLDQLQVFHAQGPKGFFYCWQNLALNAKVPRDEWFQGLDFGYYNPSSKSLVTSPVFSYTPTPICSLIGFLQSPRFFHHL